MADNNNKAIWGSSNAEVLATLVGLLAALDGEQKTRQIPITATCLRTEDIPIWKMRVHDNLGRFDLNKYIYEDVPEPADHAEKERWEIDRREVDSYIRASVPDTRIWANILGLGWNPPGAEPEEDLRLGDQIL